MSSKSSPPVNFTSLTDLLTASYLTLSDYMERLTLFHLRQPSRNGNPQTLTTIEQLKTEKLVRKAYCEKLGDWKDYALMLAKLCHIGYLTRRLSKLPTSTEHLNASQPWLAYWIVHALRLLNFTISEEVKDSLIRFLNSAQHPDGGFGGGPYQFAHLATTYGAINCLTSLCRRDALDIVDRNALYSWIMRIRQPDGSFTMHIGGEVDVRGAYCAAAVCRLTGLTKKHPELFEGTAEWIASCQTYEGGFGGHPGLEAHGGYTFCAVAALVMLERPELVDLPRLLRWVAFRQMSSEGGFQGRTNKLVDSCYSFWQGAIFQIIKELYLLAGDTAVEPNESLFNTSALQEYILLCCQKVSYTRPGLSVPNSADLSNMKSNMDSALQTGSGGLIDKPGRNPDLYHTCYALSGLSVAQHEPRVYRGVRLGQPNPVGAVDMLTAEHVDNELADLDPLHNVLHDGLAFALTYYGCIDSGMSKEEAEELAISAGEQNSAPCGTRPTVRLPDSSAGHRFETEETVDSAHLFQMCASTQ